MWSKTLKSLTWKEHDIHHLQSALTNYAIFLSLRWESVTQHCAASVLAEMGISMTCPSSKYDKKICLYPFAN
jgi:hypothetical protein